MTENKTVALFARSALANSIQYDAIEAQIAALREYCDERGYVVGHIFTDRGQPGSERGPGLDMLLKAARSEPRPFEAILACDLSRLSRNIEGFVAIRQEFVRLGIDVEFLVQPREPLRVAIYAAVDDPQDEAAMDAHLRSLERECEEDAWIVHNIYCDKGQAGMAGRLAFRQLMEDARRDPRPFDALMVRDSVSISENASPVDGFVQELDQLGIKLFFG